MRCSEPLVRAAVSFRASAFFCLWRPRYGRGQGPSRRGGYDEDSGGQVYYGTASAAYALTDFLLVRGTLQYRW